MFRAALTKMVDSCDGAMSAVLMGFDGIAIDTHVAQDFDMEAVTAELSSVLAQIGRVAESLKVGALHEVAIRSEKLTFLVRVLTPDYFLGLAMTPEGNFGKGRFLMRLAVPEFQAQL